jgi:hypothetical protein
VLRRSHTVFAVNRPELETFGESVGVLTRAVFRLEASESGFHRLLREAVQQHQTFEAASESLGGSLGSEARVVLQALLAANGNTEGA